MTRLLVVVCAVAVLVGSGAGQSQDPRKPPQPPTFRSGAHYVRVDAYPTRDGRPILGLGPEDFELLEDGKPQTIDRVEFIEHPAWTPLGERRDPNSQSAGLALARDARYRVFVLYLDAFHVDMTGSARTKTPITELLNRMMGPQDLFGVLTPAQSPKDLLLGQMTQTIQEQLQKYTWGIAGRIEPQPGEPELEYTFPREGAYLVALRRLDKVYNDLEGLIDLLGDLRDERKNIIFFSDTLPSPRLTSSMMAIDPGDGSAGRPPAIGVGPTGKPTLGSRNGEPDRLALTAERGRLLAIDFDQRFREILQSARHANVSFYTVRPGGLDMSSSLLNQGVSNLHVLAEQTDGLAVVNTNDLRGGMSRIADDLSSHYVLGYYTNNTRWDGRTRKLTVRLKPGGQAIRARREYRAPTTAEMAAIASAGSAAAAAPAAPSPAATAVSALSRLRPAARIQAYGAAIGTDVMVVAEIAATEIEEGRWKQGAQVNVILTSKDGDSKSAVARIEPNARGTVVRIPVGTAAGPWDAMVRVRGEDLPPDSDSVTVERTGAKVLGPAIAYRAASAAASAFRPLANFYFRRTERLRIDWPVLQPLESQSARLLDRNGGPLAVPVTLATREQDGLTLLSGTVVLAPLSIGDYIVEVTAKAGSAEERQLIAIRVAMAR